MNLNYFHEKALNLLFFFCSGLLLIIQYILRVSENNLFVVKTSRNTGGNAGELSSLGVNLVLLPSFSRPLTVAVTNGRCVTFVGNKQKTK